MVRIRNAWSKINREFIYAGRDAMAVLGVHKSFFRKARGARILIYHGLCKKDHTKFNPIFLTKEMFESHLQVYRDYCNVVSLDQFYAGDLNENKFNVCITFDDGFANNFNYALPLLEQYKMPGTFFITGIREAGYDILWNDFLGIVSYYGPLQLEYQQRYYRKNQFGRYAEITTGKTLVDYLKEEGFGAKEEMMNSFEQFFSEKQDDEEYWKQMTSDQIREMSGSRFVTIGSHGYYHNRMDKLSLADASKEMMDSKRYLEDLTGKEIRAFAFPYGNYSTDMVKEAKKIGYTQLLAMDFHHPEDKNDNTLRERFTVNPFLSANNQMYATIKQKYA